MRQRKRKREQRAKRRAIDPSKREEIARRIAAAEAKRQRITNDVKLSLRRRQLDRMAIENARSDVEASIRRRAIKDSRKVHVEKIMSQIRQDLRAIVEAGVKSVCPSAIVPEKVKFDAGRATLTIEDAKYKLNNNLHVVGWGKEAGAMATVLERLVGEQLKKGFIAIPRKSISAMWCYPEAFPRLDSRITLVEVGTDELSPDARTVEIAREIAAYCKRLKKRDLLIVLLSRDSDHLLCCPRDTITLRDKLRVLDRLRTANATAEEINIVRNKLSAIRGGDLARLAYPAKVVTLFTSDVSAEPSEQFGGGPCVYDPKDRRAHAILTKYKLVDKVPQAVRQLLGESGPAIRTAADVGPSEGTAYKFVRRHVIASNADAAKRMAVEALRLGLSPIKFNTVRGGTVDEFAREYAKLASLMILAAEGKINESEMYEQMRDSTVCPFTERTAREVFSRWYKWSLELCLLLGGRPTVRFRTARPGTGGPNQELALRFSLHWCMRTAQYPILRRYAVWFLGGSSYGRDGNSGAAGAYGYGSLAAGVYSEYEKATSTYGAAVLGWRRLVDGKRGESEIAEAHRAARHAKETLERCVGILPERVLRENNSNLFFSSVNGGDELLQFETGGNYYTAADVGDLHVIRIARYRCNCNGICHADEGGTRGR